MKDILYCFIIVLICYLCVKFTSLENIASYISNNETEEIISDATNETEDEDEITNSPHLKFKGVPIDGTLKKFVSRMQRKGFTKKKFDDGQAILKGDFADFKECTVYVETLSGKDLVSTITVTFPDQDKWQNLYGDYKHLKELLTTKYGKPYSCIEKFDDSYISDDNDRMYNTQMDRCKYKTLYKTSQGEITLWIANSNFLKTYVALSYKDKINGKVIKSHAINDL